MREIKFRALRLNGEGFVKGNYMHTVYKDKDDKFQIYPPLFNVPPVDIYPNTLGQFTGLKDKNGTGIYEGDIILYQDCKGEVYYQSETCMFMANFKTTHSSWSFDSMEGQIKVIGNIHENPELL